MRWRVFSRKQKEQDLEQEIQSHLQLEILQRIERGESQDDARTNAMRDFGNVAMVKEATRGAWGWQALDRLEQDLRYALRFTKRMFRREFSISLVTILTLALAIGANTALFSWFNAVLFKAPAGIGKPDELVHMGRTHDGQGFDDNFSDPSFIDYRDNNTVFSHLAAYEQATAVGGRIEDGQVEVLYRSAVSGDFFEMLQVRPQIGRLFVAADDRRGSAFVAVISHAMWQRRLDGLPSVIGTKLRLDGEVFTIVGVAPDGFTGVAPLRTDVWIPLAAHPDPERFVTRNHSWLALSGRLKPGVSIQQAQASSSLLSSRLENSVRNNDQRESIRLATNTITAQDGVALTLALVWAVPVMVLLIACANISGIGLARASTRRREIAVRLALGASRSRVVFQLLTETGVSFAIAGASGAILAPLMLTILLRMLPETDSVLSIDSSPDWRVIVFTTSVIFLAGLMSGLTPALQATRREVSKDLKEDTKSTTYRQLRLRNALVVGQIAMSLVLLIGGALFLQSLKNLVSNLGFEPDGVQVASINLATAGLKEPNGREFSTNLPSRASALPGVESAALVRYLPMDGSTWNQRVSLFSTPQDHPGLQVNHNAVSPGYFRTMRIPILNGRDFTEADRSNDLKVAVISQSVADKLWPNTDPIGQRFSNCERITERCATEVIGVVGDIRDYTVEKGQVDLLVYVPLSQAPYSSAQFLVFRTANSDAVIPSVRRLLAEMNPNLPILSLRSLREVVGSGFYIQRFAAWFAGVMGIVGLILATLGVYGVTAYGVTCRQREIGIRTALGASPVGIVALMVRDGLVLAVIGLTLGAGGSLAIARLIAAVLYEVTPTDAVSFGVPSIIVVFTVILACYIPARRAAELEPIVALRHD